MGFIEEQMYILFSTYYFEVFLYEGKIQIGRIIQAVSFSPICIVDVKRKLAFPIIPDTWFVKGHKLILHYDINKALPLTESSETKVTEISDNIVKIEKITKLSCNLPKEFNVNGKPIKLTESNFPPHMVFEMFNSYFVTKTLAKPKTTDWTLIVMAVVVAIVILAFMAIMVFGLK
jgi:hypothetical protein